MKHLEALNLLIDKASTIAGSDYKLAKELGVPRGHISAWRHGRRTATPADQAIMADLAGLDPVSTLARATVEQFEGRQKGAALMKALGKVLPAIGAALGSGGASAAQIGWTRFPNALQHLTEFIQCAVMLTRHRRPLAPS